MDVPFGMAQLALELSYQPEMGLSERLKWKQVGVAASENDCSFRILARGGSSTTGSFAVCWILLQYSQPPDPPLVWRFPPLRMFKP